MSNVAETKVTEIVNSLAELENDIDSLNSKVADMKKSLTIKAQTEIDNLMNKVKEMALKEAESTIAEAKQKAENDSSKITQDGEAKLVEIQNNIDTNFDDAVNQVVSTVLKA